MLHIHNYVYAWIIVFPLICVQNVWTHNIPDAVFTDPPVSNYALILYVYVTIHAVIINMEKIQQ